MLEKITGFIAGQKIKIIVALASLLIVAGLCAFSYFKGNANATLACEQNKVQAITEGKKNHAKIQRKVMGLPDADLDKRLSRWLR